MLRGIYGMLASIYGMLIRDLSIIKRMFASINLLQALISAVITIAILIPIIIFLGNRFLKFAFDGVAKVFSPTVKRAFGILGGKRGEVRKNKALNNEIASGVIQSTIGKWKIPLSLIGIDIDDLLDRYGPMELLGALDTFLPMLKGAGIDIGSITKGITGAGTTNTQTSNTEMGLT